MTFRVVTATAIAALLAGPVAAQDDGVATPSSDMTQSEAPQSEASQSEALDADTPQTDAEAPDADTRAEDDAPVPEATEDAMPEDDVIRVGIAEVTDPEGTSLGDVRVEQTSSGQVLVSISLEDLPAGPHGMHIHETGDCSADDFSSAGGHLAGGAEHGVLVEGGPHPGDLPNMTVPDSGDAVFDVFKPDLTLELMDDDDGAAFVVHSDPDDYTSQPSGEAGDRIACGAFEFRTE